MFDRLDSLSDELLAAYLDGNTTPEENLKIWQVLQHDGQEREAFEVACNSLDIPVFFAASSCRNLCVIRSELAVLQKRGKEVTEEELIQIALKQHWYEEEKGTPLHDVIACVDGGELSGNLEQEEFEDRWIGEIPDHVVLVRNIDYSEPPRVEVYDVAMEEPVRYYPLDRFIDSWKDSKYYMISIK